MIARDPSTETPADGSEVPEPGAPVLPPEALAVLQERFGFASLRGGQAEVVSAALADRDVLCVMPTGAGKSLCYQLPALLRDGVTLVVSPLISLMQDQVEGLQAKGIPAAAINSSVPLEDQDAILDDALAGTLKLLYVAPERFRNERFRRRSAHLPVSLVAVDEAHCISQWGHDFRPDYRRLQAAIEGLGRPPVLALTATAPPEVQDDIVLQLGLQDPVRCLHGLVRENLAYEVRVCRGRDAKERALLEALRRPGASIVYAATRRAVDAVAGLVRKAGLEIHRYHAGLPDEARARAQEAFLSGSAQRLVATNAFGMGVDRADIRQVIHYDIPGTAEAYVQETGRAGRDGESARCLLLYSMADLHVQRFFIESRNPTREVITEVFRVLRDVGERRVELTAEAIATRMHVEASTQAVAAALAILDRASLVKRGRRGENQARVTVLPTAGDLFAVQPLPPGLSRLMAHLVERFGVDAPSALDTGALAAQRGVQEETIRRGLRRLDELGRIDYVPPFRGRATELRSDAMADDVLDAVDFAFLDQKRAREEARLEEMIGYGQAQTCRTQYLLTCFGAEGDPCGRCDRCTQSEVRRQDPARRGKQAEATLRVVLEAVMAHDGRFGFGKLAGHLAGSRAEGVMGGRLGRGVTYGILGHLGAKKAEQWLRTALDEGFLRLKSHQLRGGGRRVHLLALTPAGLRVAKGGPLPSD